MEIDPPSSDQRRGALSPRAGFSLGTPSAHGGNPDPMPVLMWLAGAGYRPKDEARRKGMVPVAKQAEEAADRVFDTSPPGDMLQASRVRAEMLATLHREARGDPRVEEVFDHDPILASDPDTGWLVTESMLRARFALIDALHTLLGKPPPEEATHAAIRETLVDAFTYLSPESQREWCYSELRLEQGTVLLENRTPVELMALADALRPIHKRRGPWDALRLFGVAAAMNAVEEGDLVPVSELLSMRHRGAEG